ncbi:hypothetical protein FOMG_03846 [Fusarium oxysporum f. sp. melonis 26406]|uniref:Uncharacterized protein n=1 Tax=Fusarium oxysporum f. sp. melonis 26406 TaxID=1089452 RepID=X0ANT4_FUSOX|nr:hypothetical protein FOMG_03846 [Fusarium oxysporum f. sp. melonis 26406]
MNRLNTIATPEVASGLLLASVFRYLPCNSARFCPLAGAFGVPQVSPLPARRKVVLHKGCSTPVPSALRGVRPVRQWSAYKSSIVNSLLDGILLLAFCLTQ